MDDNRRYPHEIAALLRLASGEWIEIRRDTPHRISAVIQNYRKRPPAAYPPGRFEFRISSLGYGSGVSRLMARHMPVTFPIER